MYHYRCEFVNNYQAQSFAEDLVVSSIHLAQSSLPEPSEPSRSQEIPESPQCLLLREERIGPCVSQASLVVIHTSSAASRRLPLPASRLCVTLRSTVSFAHF